MSEEDDQLAMELSASSNEPDLGNMATEPAPIEDFDQRHFLDCIQIHEYMNEKNNLTKLIESDAEISIMVDLNWRKLYHHFQLMNHLHFQIAHK